MESGFGVSVWFFQSGRRDQYTIWLKSPLVSRTIAWYMRSKLTIGMPQMTASTARRCNVRWARSAAVNGLDFLVSAFAVIAGFLVDVRYAGLLFVSAPRDNSKAKTGNAATGSPQSAGL